MAMSHEETIKKKLYQNWIKSGLGLKYLKEGLQPFVTQVIKDQHTKFVEKLQPCSSCSLGTLLPKHASKVGRNCSLGCEKCLCIGSKHTIRTQCPNDVCGKIYDKIIMSHFFLDPNFSNTDVTKWVEGPWELAKCYINAWGYKDKMSAEDTDCIGILSIIINDTEFYSLIDHATIDTCSKVRTYRNDIMHSSSLEVEDVNLKTYIEDMIAILNDPNQLKDEEYAESARTQLQKLLDKEIHIATSDEISVIQEAQRVQARRLDNMIQDLDQMKKENQKQFDCIEKVQDSLRKAMDNDQQKLAADIEQIKKDVESLKTELKDNCLQKIQDILHRLESEKQKKTEDKLKEHLKYLEDKNRLREKLFEIYENHLSTRPISPIVEEVCAHVGDIYVDLVICDHLFKEQLENRKQSKIGVKSYRDIFFRNDKQCFDMYMLGEAGMGKTTWCVKLVNDWVNVSKNKFDEARNSDLKCFEVVILVFLRNATEEVKILDMIKEQLFSENIAYYEILTKILRKEPQKCLIIADGLDEWTMLKKQVSVSFTQNQNIPSKMGLNSCPLLITSRISKIYDISLKENEFDTCVKIEGIKEPDKLAANIINELNKLSNDKVKRQFKDFHKTIEQIRLKPFIASLPFVDKTPISECMNVPLLLIISVCIWFQYGKIEPTLAGIYCEMFKYLFDYTRSMKKYEFSSPVEKASDGTEASSLPKELLEKIPPQCVDLIQKLSKFAFDRLFEDCDESPQKLVFDEQVLRKWFSSSDLQAAEKCGILSKSIFVNQPLKRTASMSFLHKSFQEFLSAVYTVSQLQNGKKEPFEVFLKYCCNYEKLSEMENVLLFVCGLDPQAASQMSLHVLSIAKQTLKTETKSSDIQKSDYLMKNLPLKCTIQVHENNKDYPSTEYPIHIEQLSLSLNDISRYLLSGHIKYIYKMLTSNTCKLMKVDVHLGNTNEIVILQWRPLTVGGLHCSSPQPYRVEVGPFLQHCELPFSLKECALEYLDLSQFSAQQLKAFGKSLKELTQLESLKLIHVNYSPSITLSLHNCRLRSLKLIDTNIVVKANVQDLKTLEVKNCSVKLLKEFQSGHDSQILRIDHSSHAEIYSDTINIYTLNQMFSVFLLIPETKLKVGNSLFENKFVNENTNLLKIDSLKNFRSCIQYDLYNKYVVTYSHDNMQTNEMEQFLSLLDIYSISKVQHVDFVFEDMNVNVYEQTLTDFLRKCEISKVELKNTSLQDSGDKRKRIQLRNFHLSITNNSVIQTQNILKYVVSTESIESLSFFTVIIEHGLLAYLFSTKHLTYLKIILSRQQNPVFEAIEVWKSQQNNCASILLQQKILTCLNTSKQETQRCVELAASNCDIRSVKITTDIIDDKTILTIFENKHLKTSQIELLKGEMPLVKVLESMMNEEICIHRELIELKDNRVTFQLQWQKYEDCKAIFALTCSNTTKQETQRCVELASCNCGIRSVKITTDFIDDETIATIFENKHFKTSQINLLKGEIPLVKILETMMNEEICEHRALIGLKDNRVTFQLQSPKDEYFKKYYALVCLNATMQETQQCVKLASSNCDHIKLVRITTDFIDDETIASLIDYKHLYSVRIEVLQGEVSFVQVIETMMTEQTFINVILSRLFHKERGVLKVQESEMEYKTLLQSEKGYILEIRSNRCIITLQVNFERKRLLLTCLHSTLEETRYVEKLVKSNRFILFVDLLTESIDDETFANLITCDHLKELNLGIKKVEPNQREKLSKLWKDSKFHEVYDPCNIVEPISGLDLYFFCDMRTFLGKYKFGAPKNLV